MYVTRMRNSVRPLLTQMQRSIDRTMLKIYHSLATLNLILRYARFIKSSDMRAYVEVRAYFIYYVK